MTTEGDSELEAAEEKFDRAKKDYNELEHRILDHMYGRVQYNPNALAELKQKLKEADKRVIETKDTVDSLKR